MYFTKEFLIYCHCLNPSLSQSCPLFFHYNFMFVFCICTALRREGHTVHTEQFFDTIKVTCASGDRGRQDVLWRAEEKRINLRQYDDGTLNVQSVSEQGKIMTYVATYQD